MIPEIDLTAEIGPVTAESCAHFIGIGGAGMSSVAALWRTAGATVSGSDAKPSEQVDALRELGVRIQIGHDPANVRAGQTVVVSSAVRTDNPEVVAARALGLKILHRSQALAALSGGKRVVAIAGTNGKTTTTAMVTTALRQCDLDPAFSIGGELISAGTNAYLGTDDILVLEADESDGTFVVYHPHIAVVTNIQADHLDFYGTQAGVDAGFAGFGQTIKPDGVLVACADDPGSLNLAESIRATGVRVLTYGESQAADFKLTEISSQPGGTRFTLSYLNQTLPVEVSVPGRHNALNATAAIAVAISLGCSFEAATKSLANFSGTRRRFEFRGVSGATRIFDDYAHNPAKLRAAVQTGRQAVGSGWLTVVFQPHLYSRTRDFAPEFGQALSAADEVVVLDVYGAREDPIPGVTGQLIADAISLPQNRVHYFADRATVAGRISEILTQPGLLLTIGAGDITTLALEIGAQ